MTMEGHGVRPCAYSANRQQRMAKVAMEEGEGLVGEARMMIFVDKFQKKRVKSKGKEQDKQGNLC